MSDNGFRSLELLTDSENLQDLDVGTPIETLTSNIRNVAFSFYNTHLGQYWCCADGKVWVLSLSQTSGIFAWSEFAFGDRYIIDGVSIGDDVYLLQDNGHVYTYTEVHNSDDGDDVDFSAELVKSDLGEPIRVKRLSRLDVIMEGEANLTLRINDSQDALMNMELVGDTRGNTGIPMVGLATTVQLGFSGVHKEPLVISGVDLYYKTGGRTP